MNPASYINLNGEYDKTTLYLKCFNEYKNHIEEFNSRDVI